MGKYQGYEKYKDSGVEWLGEIPEHWKRSVFRYYFDIQLGKMLQNAPQSENDEEISYLKAIHVRWDKVDTYDLPKMWASPKDKDKYYVKNGDLLISEGGEVGRTAFLKELQEDCIIQNALHRVRPLSQSSVEYLNYLMRHISDTGWFDILCNKSTIAHLTSEKLGALALPLPPLDEQKTIAQFLDHKTKQIDELIAKKEALLEKLDEKRTALIRHAITKGLDPNVWIKDSGVEWLGDIPDHWEVVAIKRCFDIRDGTHDTPQYVEIGEEAVPLITSKDFDNDLINFQLAKYISITDHQEISKRSKVDYGDVLMSMIGGNIGKSLIVKTPQEFSIKNVALFKANNDLELSNLLLYYLTSGLLDIQISLKNRGGAQGFLSLNDIRNLVFLKIPSSERKTIVDYLAHKTAEIDQQKAKIQKAIELLKEYRTALITNAVTGKIDVRQVPIP